MDSLLKDRLSLLAAVSCGVAFGVSGIYSYYRANREFTQQIDSLTSTIDDLRKEVYELRMSSQAASRAASHVDTPMGYRNDNFTFDHSIYLSSPLTLETNDSHSSHSRFDSSTDENEEFYDFT
jgi:hypothetical protein